MLSFEVLTCEADKVSFNKPIIRYSYDPVEFIVNLIIFIM